MNKNSKFSNKYCDEYRNNFLTVINLTKQYKKNMKPAINNLNFIVGPGEFHAFIGGNGAGKTTTIKSIIGAYANYIGKIYFCGYLNTTIEAKRLIGYIPEVARFPENTSTRNYLINMALLSEVKRKDVKKIVDQILIDLNMQNLAKKSPNSFSSGQKKKILLAQALIHDPKILIMDEPAANLDPRARIEFFETLKKLQNNGKSIFISSHILDEIDKYATHATILDGGQVVFSKKLDEYRKSKQKSLYLKFKNNNLAKEWFKKQKINFEIDSDRNVFIIKLHNINSEDLLSKLIENKICPIYYEINAETLEEIFYHYVIKGSVHTMKNN